MRRAKRKSTSPGIEFLEPGCRWNALINAISTYINGVELDQLSARDFWRYRDTGVNWRVVEGYGTLVAASGAGLDVALDCPAHRDRPWWPAHPHRDAAR